MRTASELARPPGTMPLLPHDSPSSSSSSSGSEFKVIRRNGAVVGFDPYRISVAMTKVFPAVSGEQCVPSTRIRDLVAQLAQSVTAAPAQCQSSGGTFHIEDIEEQVEIALVRTGEGEVARAIEFYEVLSDFGFICSAPPLFISGAQRPRFGSCYLGAVSDVAAGIIENIIDDALLAKFAGGLGKGWMLFSPSDVPDLDEKVGGAFEEAYLSCEDKAARGGVRLFRKPPTVGQWRRMPRMLFGTALPSIAFKDRCNIPSPQSPAVVVHGSNLWTKIARNTLKSEIAGCNLGSMNLAARLRRIEGRGDLDHGRLKRTIATAMRTLDIGTDVNYCAVGKARNANLWLRPIGFGVLPDDSLDLLADERGGWLEVDRSATVDPGGASSASPRTRHA